MTDKNLKNKEQAFKFLTKINAPEHLIQHVTLVGEAADMLIAKLKGMKVELDFDFIQAGVVIHDVGKSIHQNEMTGPGSEHEPAGEKFLLEQGVSPKLARVCLSHARWRKMKCSSEELLIALSDKLWKGKRVEELELKVIDRISELLNVERWDVFPDLDSLFEDIASGGDNRLQRSVKKL